MFVPSSKCFCRRCDTIIFLSIHTAFLSVEHSTDIFHCIFFVHLQMRWKTHIILVAISNQLAWRILSFVEINAHYKMAMENCLRMNRNKIKKLLLFWCVWSVGFSCWGKKWRQKELKIIISFARICEEQQTLKKEESCQMENARWWTNCALSVCMCTLHTRRNIDQINYGNCIFFCSTLLAIFLPQSGVRALFSALSPPWRLLFCSIEPKAIWTHTSCLPLQISFL